MRTHGSYDDRPVSDVGLFATCLGDAVQPQVVRDTAAVLRAAGADPVPVRGATCCGQPAFNSGFDADARRVAARTLRALRAHAAVVVPAGSCAAMIRLHWPQLFREHRDRAQAELVAARTYELSQYLVDVLGVTSIGGRSDLRATYHDSCHMLRELRIHDQPRRLLSGVATLVEMPRADRCCGFGGTFSVRYPEVSAAIADDKLAQIAAAGADVAVSADPGCLMQIDGRRSRTGPDVRVAHLATVLAEAL